MTIVEFDISSFIGGSPKMVEGVVVRQGKDKDGNVLYDVVKPVDPEYKDYVSFMIPREG